MTIELTNDDVRVLGDEVKVPAVDLWTEPVITIRAHFSTKHSRRDVGHDVGLDETRIYSINKQVMPFEGYMSGGYPES